MKTTFTRLLSTLLILVAFLWAQTSVGQTGVLNPNDPIVNYNSASPPATPPFGTLAKWVRTQRFSWNSTSYKAYFYKGIAFRLKWPKNYVSDGSKKYPLFVFFHGIGEKGTIYDNEFQFYHGGQKHMNAVENGQFDGFLLYPQTSSSSGGWSDGQIDIIAELIRNYLIPQVNVDPFRVISNGLSGGGAAAWNIMVRHKTLIAASLPMSGSAIQHVQDVPNLIYNAWWLSNGGLDDAPSPYTVNQVLNAASSQGANYRHTFFPNLGHGVWNDFWNVSDYFPYMMKANKVNPWPRFGRTEFCNGDNINVTIGVTAGFEAYEWRRNGTPLPNTGNTITATSVGTYDCRVKYQGQWSYWSPIPVEIKYKAPTYTPDIQLSSSLVSNVLPAPDGTTSVTLTLPAGYASYAWQKLNPTTNLPSTTNTVTGATPGTYIARVTEQYGCSSEWSNQFTVINANGPNPPSAPSGLTATTLSQTEIKLNWSIDPSPTNMETAFELYRATSQDGPYKLVAFVPARTTTYTAEDLDANTRYYFIMRAINATAGSAVTSPASSLTESDVTKPTPPGNLRTGSLYPNGVELVWDASTDDVGIAKYDIYVNGNLAHTVTDGDATSFSVYNLNNGVPYTFVVRAVDPTGNVSTPSNQVVASPQFSGLNYKHYTFTGEWTALQDLNALTPVKTGNVPNVTLNGRVQEDNYAFLWEGFIRITQAGTYYFRTTSDDGSRLWLGSLNGTTSPYVHGSGSIVNNDGLHGSQSVNSSARTLSVGVYPIAIAYYEQGGDASMSIAWRTPNSGTSYVSIPNSQFVQTVSLPEPPAPIQSATATAVSAKKINLTWVDNSNNETAFEIYRSTSANGNYQIIATVAANTTSYSDSSLEAGTTYFYKLKTINGNGASDFGPGQFANVQAKWPFNNNLNEASGSGRTLSGNSSPGFSTDRQEGSHSVDLNGNNQDMTVNTSSGDYLRGGYNQKTVAFWMRADNTSNNRGIFDFGGADDGLAMRINSNTLYAGVASNNTRRSIQTSYNSTGWNHIALVYNVNTLRLYVNGVEVASNTSLGFNSIGTTTGASAIGDDNGDNALNTSFSNFDGHFDNFMVFSAALTPQQIQSTMTDTYGLCTATTLPLPAVPAAPSALAATLINPIKVGLSWTNNANNAVALEVWRSLANNANYERIATLDPGTTSYQDDLLQPLSTYYYKLRAVNEGGNSNYSNEVNIATGAVPNSVVTFPAIANQTIVNDVVVNIPLNATTDIGTSITYSSTNLPSFATLVTNPNGTGQLTLSPAMAHLGNFSATITATDNFGSTASRTFDIVVNGNNARDININFNLTLPQPAPWNNTNSLPNAGVTVNNLKTTDGATTTAGITLVTSYTSAWATGPSTGNNSGPVPDNVMKTLYFSSAAENAPSQMRLTGLSSSKKYSIIFFAGYPWTQADRNQYGDLFGNYRVGQQTVTLDAANNTQNTVRINGIVPDASGNILISMFRSVGSGFVIISAMTVIEYDASAPVAGLSPAYNLVANGTSSSAIKLTWNAPAETRTGFQIWRSTTPNGTYSQVGTVAGNVYTYTNSGLGADQTFFYKVRSVNGAVTSDYSNIAGGSTVAYVVNLNLNATSSLSEGNPAWDNLNTLLSDGFSKENLKNSMGQNTGINFNVVRNFFGFNSEVGITTNNNSGVVPDNVMKTFYYIEFGDSSKFSLSGLPKTGVYNVVLYAGTTFAQLTNTTYNSQGQTTQLNALGNTTQTVTLANLVPDSTGTIVIGVKPTLGYGFLNSITIQGMTSPATIKDGNGNEPILSRAENEIVEVEIETTPDEPSQTAGTEVTSAQARTDVARNSVAATIEEEKVEGLNVFPNPFVNNVTVKFDFKQDVSNFALVVTDMAGKVVMQKSYGSAKKGIWQQSLNLGDKAPGMYMVRMIGLPEAQQPKAVHLLKKSGL